MNARRSFPKSKFYLVIFFLVFLVLLVVNLPGCSVDTSARARDVRADVVLFQVNVHVSPPTSTTSQPENQHGQ